MKVTFSQLWKRDIFNFWKTLLEITTQRGFCETVNQNECLSTLPLIPTPQEEQSLEDNKLLEITTQRGRNMVRLLEVLEERIVLSGLKFCICTCLKTLTTCTLLFKNQY